MHGHGQSGSSGRVEGLISKGPSFPSCLPHFRVVCLNLAWFTFNIKICLRIVRECDGEDGGAVDQ